jgi:hypothetical protein
VGRWKVGQKRNETRVENVRTEQRGGDEMPKEEIHRFSNEYRDRLYTHPNNLTVPPDHRQLRHLHTRFHE